MRNIWLFIIPPIVIAILIFVTWYLFRIHSHERDLKRVAVIAHTKTIKLLPAYKRALRHYRMLLIFAALSFLLSAFSLTAVAARPVSRVESTKESENRDVVLCLDVSGSMRNYQEDILSVFANIINGLHGQRVAITIFDGVPASLIPLSDDYDTVAEIIESLSKEFSAYSSAVIGDTSSAIGDGVMGCINSMDLEDSERSKSIIIATDNYSGQETVDINQAARYAKRFGITFYGMSTNASNTSRQDLLFKNAVQITNGSFYNINKYVEGNSSAGEIVEKIMKQDAAKSEGAVEVYYNDNPAVYLVISAASLATFLVLLWRLRL